MQNYANTAAHKHGANKRAHTKNREVDGGGGAGRASQRRRHGTKKKKKKLLLLV